MNFAEQFMLLQRIANLIKMKATGTPKDLAEKVEVSRSALYRHIDTLKSLGASINYCKHRRTYYFEKDFSLEIL